MNIAHHVVRDIHQTNLGPRPLDTSGADEFSTHRVLLVTKYMLEQGAGLRTRSVYSLLGRTQRPAPTALVVYLAAILAILQPLLGLGAAIGTVRPHRRAGIGLIQNLVECGDGSGKFRPFAPENEPAR